MNMDTIEQIINNIWVQRIFWSVLTILSSTLIYVIFSHILAAREKRSTKIFSNKKNRTFLKMLKSVIRYFLIILTALIILQIFGVNVTSMLAGVGIIGIIIGFAIQDALKDIIKGLDIISDNYYNVGDVIKFGDITGKVIAVGLKTTKLQDVSTGNSVSIANRNIDQVEVVSDAIYLNIPLPYELPVESAEKILKDAIDVISKHRNVKKAELLGLNKLNDSSMDYLICVNCDPILKLSIRRFALRTIATTLDDNKISIPYPQLDIPTHK